jgi:CheY-like chemotaxis protein
MSEKPELSILLIEDHDDSREAIKNWLEWKGYQVFSASTRAAGVALARKHAIDLLICDLQLPDGNGWEVMEQLKPNGSIYGILTSGHCSGADITRSKAVGYLEHLVKPYPVEELTALLGRVQKLLKERNAKPPARAPVPPRRP